MLVTCKHLSAVVRDLSSMVLKFERVFFERNQPVLLTRTRRKAIHCIQNLTKICQTTFR